jgi:hypothetical protein
MLRQPQKLGFVCRSLVRTRMPMNSNLLLNYTTLRPAQMIGYQLNAGSLITPGGMRGFSTKNDDPAEPKPKPKKMTKVQKLAMEKEALASEGVVDAAPAKKPRKPRLTKAQKAAEEAANETNIGEPRQMYVMKFNTPILPFSKFPLTQNKYIQSFLKQYEEDLHKIDQVLGVHFPNNNNEHAVDTVGIEIKITKKNNVTSIESASTRRFKIVSYNSGSNFCMAQEFTDHSLEKTFNSIEGKEQQGVSLQAKDLLQSDLYELKNLWVTYNKKINGLLMVLPTEVLNRYDMVVKSL